MSKHTPGPWHITFGGYITSDVYGYVPIHTPFREDAFLDGPERSAHDKETLHANARLIAAAPELLDVLQFILDVAPDIAEDSTGDDFNWRIKAHDVIAKAKGE